MELIIKTEGKPLLGLMSFMLKLVLYLLAYVKLAYMKRSFLHQFSIIFRFVSKNLKRSKVLHINCRNGKMGTNLYIIECNVSTEHSFRPFPFSLSIEWSHRRHGRILLLNHSTEID